MVFCGKLVVGAVLAAGVASAAIDIDVGRQLFVDDWLVDGTQGIVRVYNHPTKAFDAPVMWPETDLEREVDPSRPYRFAPVAGAVSGGLWWDPVKKVFRLWYEAGWMITCATPSRRMVSRGNARTSAS